MSVGAGPRACPLRPPCLPSWAPVPALKGPVPVPKRSHHPKLSRAGCRWRRLGEMGSALAETPSRASYGLTVACGRMAQGVRSTTDKPTMPGSVRQSANPDPISPSLGHELGARGKAEHSRKSQAAKPGSVRQSANSDPIPPSLGCTSRMKGKVKNLISPAIPWGGQKGPAAGPRRPPRPCRRWTGIRRTGIREAQGQGRRGWLRGRSRSRRGWRRRSP